MQLIALLFSIIRLEQAAFPQDKQHQTVQPKTLFPKVKATKEKEAGIEKRIGAFHPMFDGQSSSIKDLILFIKKQGQKKAGLCLRADG
jgi:hypothetical protein